MNSMDGSGSDDALCTDQFGIDQFRTDQFWMKQALSLAIMAEEGGEVPVGAVLVLSGKIIGQGWNQPILSHDPSAHAEIIALRQGGGKVGNYRLLHSTLYVTLEPCSMCAGAALYARIDRLVYGAPDPKTGAVDSVHQLLSHPSANHRVAVSRGVLQNECAAILTNFFRRRRRDN